MGWRKAFSLLLAIALIALVVGCGGGEAKRENNLQASVRFVGARFEVTNEDDVPWEDVTLRVVLQRETYTYDKELGGTEGLIRIDPGETQSYKMGAFVARGGRQLGSLLGSSSDRLADQAIIECTVNGQPGYWAGAPTFLSE